MVWSEFGIKNMTCVVWGYFLGALWAPQYEGEPKEKCPVSVSLDWKKAILHPFPRGNHTREAVWVQPSVFFVFSPFDSLFPVVKKPALRKG